MFLMKRLIVVISCFLIIGACSHLQYQMVEIVWKESQSSAVRVQWMGIRLVSWDIVTSAHIVRDDSLVYQIGNIPYSIRMRDAIGDRAVLSKNYTWWIITDGAHITSLFWANRENIQKWDPVYTEVTRSGRIVQISGKILDLNASILGYDTLGRLTTLSGIVLTDMILSPWDSGAGIFTLSGELVDVVHVK